MRARDDGKGREHAVKKGSDYNGPPYAGTPTPDWVGRVGSADMAGKRPLCALGPMMSALILRLLLIKEKEQDNRSHRCPPAHELAQA